MLIAVCAGYLLVLMDYSVVNVSLHTIQQRFGAAADGLQWTVNAYEILFGALLLPAGFLADRCGHRRVLIGGLVLFGLASAGMVTSDRIGEVIAWRVLMGVGGSAIPVTTLAVLQSVPSLAGALRPVSLWAAMPGASFALGPIFGGACAGSWGWWAPFLVNLPLALVCALVVGRYAADSPRIRAAKLDWPGVLLVISSVGMLLLAVSRSGAVSWLDLSVAGPVCISAGLAVCLVKVELKHKTPVLDLRLFRDRLFAAGTACVALAFFSLAGAIFLVPAYLQVIRGQAVFEASLSIVGLACGSAPGSLLAGRVQRRFGPRIAGMTAMVTLAAGLGGFAAMGSATSLPSTWLWFVLAGAGFGMTGAVSTPLTMSSVPLTRVGTATGTATLTRTVSSALSVALLGTVCSFDDRASIAALREFRTALWITAGTAAAGAFVAASYFPRKGSPWLLSGSCSPSSSPSWPHGSGAASPPR
ncbi:MFS transporter [Amycolatopsis sp. NPDC059090]|uniref:MFS transporter n=1 Tax=Amycolatopsis sp. NPDC059090 TaxID=3346723 RepID=UPI00366AD312